MSCTWLTIQEAADWTKVHPTTIMRYIRLGKLEAFRPSSHTVRICLEELDALGRGKMGKRWCEECDCLVTACTDRTRHTWKVKWLEEIKNE